VDEGVVEEEWAESYDEEALPDDDDRLDASRDADTPNHTERHAGDANVMSDGIDTVLDAELFAAERGERRLSSMGGAGAAARVGSAFGDDPDADMVALGAFEGDGDILGSEIMLQYFESEAAADKLSAQASQETPVQSPQEISAQTPAAARSASGAAIPAALESATDLGDDAAIDAELSADDEEEWEWEEADPTGQARTHTPKRSPVAPMGSGRKSPLQKEAAAPLAAPGSASTPPTSATSEAVSPQGFASPLNVSRALRGIEQELDQAMEDALASPAQAADDAQHTQEDEDMDSSIDRAIAGEGEPTMLVA
jgi:hypothetical protein